MDVYNVDGVPTVFTYIHKNVAKGYILERNINLKPCYIVKGNGYFAHGETIAEAQKALEEKIMDNLDIGEKIKLFKEKFPEIDKKYPAKDFYQWHHVLTGSCEMGRKSFATNHSIDIENDMLTVREFIDLTENAYCGVVIKQLRESYGDEKGGRTMTDNEIIKASECCNGEEWTCRDCPLYEGDAGCIKKLTKLSYDLINRQKAEIERYKGVIKLLEEDVQTAKTEAIKEFAARLKCGVPQETGVIRCADVDSLVKEMEGGAEWW